eukprot:3092129-Amphidinium_carterae.2
MPRDPFATGIVTDSGIHFYDRSYAVVWAASLREFLYGADLRHHKADTRQTGCLCAIWHLLNTVDASLAAGATHISNLPARAACKERW